MTSRIFLKFCVLLVCFSFSLSSPIKLEENSKLHGVVVLFRHGDRSPCCDDTWPTDPYYWVTSLWPDGHGALNNMGKKHHFQLGQWFRSRYQNFLPMRYNRSEIYVRSTDIDRTIMSAQSDLAGLYYPIKSQIFEEDINWQPIPVHTVPQSQDAVLLADVTCPKFDKLRNELLTSDRVSDILSEHQETLDKISIHTGMENVTLSNMASIFSSVTIYRQFNLSLPSWTEELWPEIKKLAAIKFQLNTFTPELAKLRRGRFFDYLLDHLYAVKSQVVNNISDDENPKFLMLSAHDDTLADVTNAMNAYPGAVPHFASTIIWELRSVNDKYFVNMYFKNDTHIVNLTAFDCAVNCELNQFMKVLENVTLDEESYKTECEK